MAISVATIERNPMMSELLGRALQGHYKHFSVVACGGSTQDFLVKVAEHKPDIAVVSAILQNDPGGGLKLVRELRGASPETRVIVLLDCSDAEQVVEAFSAGAKGVVCKSDPFETLYKCMRSVYAGQIWASSQELQWIVKALGDREPVRIFNAKGIPILTKREDEIVRMVVESLPNSEIAKKLSVSAHTVKNHLFRIYEKLGVSNRVELTLYALSSHQKSQGSSGQTPTSH
jgi:DNA-binding NarL/FixJ family response regulator